MNSAVLAMGWGAAAGLLVALAVTIWVLNAVLSLLRRYGPRNVPGEMVAEATRVPSTFRNAS